MDHITTIMENVLKLLHIFLGVTLSIAENWYEDLRHPKTFATKKIQGTGTAIKPKSKPKSKPKAQRLLILA